MSLGKKTVQGMLWNYVSFASGKFLAFISTIVLAWLGLGPDQFGQVAIALLVVTYLDGIGDLGIAAALIYQRNDVERAAHTAFVISVVTGVFLWIAGSLAAPIIGDYFNEPAVVPMIRVLAITMPIQSLGNVHMALLSKELEFRRRLPPDLARNFSKGIGAIVLAFLSFGPWSLVWGQVLGALAGTIALWIVQPWRPRFMWDSQLGSQMLGYGIQILLIEILAVLWTTADYILVARYLGKSDLGLYQMAFRISDLLIINICIVAGRVLFSSYSKINDSLEAVRRGYLVTLRYVTLVTLPIAFGLTAIAPVFVSLLLGTEWIAMTPALQWLALRAGIASISFNSGHVLKAIGRPAIVNKQMVLKLAVMVSAVAVMLPFGFVSVAMAQAGVAIFSVLLDFGTIRYILQVPIQAMWTAIRPALLSAAGMGVVVWIFGVFASQRANTLQIVGMIGIGALFYVGMLWLTERDVVAESVSRFAHAIRREQSVAAKS